MSSKEKNRKNRLSTTKDKQPPAPNTISLKALLRLPSPKARIKRKQRHVQKRATRKRQESNPASEDITVDSKRQESTEEGRSKENYQTFLEMQNEDGSEEAEIMDFEKRNEETLSDMAQTSARQHYDNFINRILSDRAQKNQSKLQAKKQWRDAQTATSAVISRIRSLTSKKDENRQW